jgi:hypothetical protein
VLSAVAASITLALTTLAYKGLILSSSARESQYAFYAADSALECALLWDNHDHNQFAYGKSATSGVQCAGVYVTSDGTGNVPGVTSSGKTKYQSDWFPINKRTVNGATVWSCGRITVYKSSTGQTDLFGDGTNADCNDLSNPRAIERGLKAFY